MRRLSILITSFLYILKLILFTILLYHICTIKSMLIMDNFSVHKLLVIHKKKKL